jgi:hypothetical protein
MRACHGIYYKEIGTLKPRYNDPFNNKISAIKNLILSPSDIADISDRGFSVHTKRKTNENIAGEKSTSSSGNQLENCNEVDFDVTVEFCPCAFGGCHD